MLKLRSKVITVLTVLATLLLITSAVLFCGCNVAKAEKNAIDADSKASIESSYVIGSTLTVPSAKVVVGGQSYDAEAVYMYTPSNKLYTVGGTYVFDEIGKHVLVYVASVDGENQSAEVEIMVNDHSYTASKLTKVTNIDSLSVLSEGHAQQSKGIKVEMPFTDTFRWQTAVDLRETGLETPLISFLPYQYSMEKAVLSGQDGSGKDVYTTPNQASNIYVRMTDAYDKSNYVDVRLEYFLDGSTANQLPAYAASANGNAMRACSTNLGRDSRDGKIMFVGDKQYFVTYAERGGYPYLGGIVEDSCLISLYYDVKTNQVYVGQQQKGEDYEVEMINDVDAPEIYGSSVFGGFTTGEVYISIYAETYQTAMVEMEIVSIGKQKGVELQTNESVDTVKPVIDIDVSLDQMDKEIFIAKGQEVSILNAKAWDVNLKDYSVKVEYNDNSIVTVRNNRFVAEGLGKYTITYTAEDYAGNKTIEKIVYNCIDRSANNNKLIEFEVAKYAGATSAGTIAKLPEITKFSSPNTYLDLEIYAMYNNDYANRIKIDKDVRELKLSNVGTYTIVYEYKDVLEAGKFSYDITTSASADNYELPTVEELPLPKYILSNAYYSFDAVYATTYEKTTPEKVEVSYEARTLKDGVWSEWQAIDYHDYKVEAGEKIQFKYIYKDKTLASNEIPLINDAFDGGLGMSDFTKYFQGDISIEEIGTNFAMVSNVNSGETTIDFINVLSLSSFTVYFNIPNEMSNYKTIEFELTDYLDRNNKVAVSYTNSGSGIKFAVVGGNEVTANKAYAGTVFKLTYYKDRGQFADLEAGTSVDWANTFTSDRVLLSIKIKGISGKAGAVVEKISTTNISTDAYSTFKPSLIYGLDYKGNQAVGTLATISAAEGIDVACPSYYGNEEDTKIRVWVSKVLDDGSEEPLTSMDGVVLDGVDATRSYKVRFDEIGSYVINYQYYSQNGNNTTGLCNINIIDEVKPTITIDGGYNEYSVIGARLGDVIKAKGWTATDNFDDEEDLIVNVVVFDPMFAMYDLIDNGMEIDDMKFTAEYKGTYVVYYYAEDSSGNVATASYKIYVE